MSIKKCKMLNKKQMKDFEECVKMSNDFYSNDKDCLSCSCNICLAQTETEADKKLQDIREYVDKRLKTLRETDTISSFLITELIALKHYLEK